MLQKELDETETPLDITLTHGRLAQMLDHEVLRVEDHSLQQVLSDWAEPTGRTVLRDFVVNVVRKVV